uniref:Uncharacterized protein n=1 Tax=Steinernema glaseri TaxID=37863 RepID=A0A1I7YC84_9BILA
MATGGVARRLRKSRRSGQNKAGSENKSVDVAQKGHGFDADSGCVIDGPRGCLPLNYAPSTPFPFFSKRNKRPPSITRRAAPVRCVEMFGHVPGEKGPSAPPRSGDVPSALEEPSLPGNRQDGQLRGYSCGQSSLDSRIKQTAPENHKALKGQTCKSDPPRQE